MAGTFFGHDRSLELEKSTFFNVGLWKFLVLATAQEHYHAKE
jgi:hypothetical protein